MEIKKIKIIRAIDQTPIFFGFPVDRAAIFLMLILADFFIFVKSFWIGVLFSGIMFLLIYLYLKGYLQEKKIFYQKYRYLVFNKNIRINKINNRKNENTYDK
jgi:predicted membrane protein